MARGLHQTAPNPDKTEHHRESYSTRQNNFHQKTTLRNQNVKPFSHKLYQSFPSTVPSLINYYPTTHQEKDGDFLTSIRAFNSKKNFEP